MPDQKIELHMGHCRISATTDLYAPFRPEYLAHATRTIEAVIDEIEVLVPSAFYRSRNGDKLNIVPLTGAKSA